ncbi:MAG: peptidylprolyl isomerase [Candidatus Enteromonas sp.]
MKKGKLLTIVTGLTAIASLAGCNNTSYKEGVAITFTNADGTRTTYTAAELFSDYQDSTATANSDFSKVKEILIREYYAQRTADLEELKKKASTSVEGIKNQAQSNANNNGTTYAAELEALLTGEDVDNIEELYEKKLYAAELEKFEEDFKAGDNLKYIRDGKRADGSAFFPADEHFGLGNGGYIETRMPYNVSHILLEASSASESDATSTAISEAEAKTFGDVILMMAGASTEDSVYGKASATVRQTFGTLAKTYSKDTGSAESYGNLGIMDVETSFVQGFQYGVYAYDTLFNQTTSEFKSSRIGNLKFSSDATYRTANGEEKSLESSTLAGGVFDAIGQIPFGAAVALANDEVQRNFPTQTFKVNDGNSAYMPRNVIWNKYFNSHRIAVVTPNRIAYNDVIEAGFDKTTAESIGSAYVDVNGRYKKDGELNAWKGKVDSDYAALPGFQHDTKDILPGVKDSEGNAENVLTNEKGQVILAVRGDSGTKGIHFIVVDRSPLSEYGTRIESNKVVENDKAYYDANAATADVTNLSEYFTFENPETSTSYPTYKDGEVSAKKTTLISQGLDTTKANYQKNIDNLKSTISSFNSDLMETYEVQKLVADTNAVFNVENASVKKIVDNIYTFSTAKRQKSKDDAQKKLDDAWTKYAEFLVREDEARALRDDGGQKLITEAAAILYNTDGARDKTGAWGNGGACYEKR